MNSIGFRCSLCCCFSSSPEQGDSKDLLSRTDKLQRQILARGGSQEKEEFYGVNPFAESVQLVPLSLQSSEAFIHATSGPSRERMDELAIAPVDETLLDYENPDNYEWLAEIEEGAHSRIHEVRFRPTQEHFALKVSNKKHEHHLRQECDLLRGLRHPNIIRIHAKFHVQIKGVTYKCILLDLAQADLFTYIENLQQNLTEKGIYLLFSQIVKGVQYLHQKGICHRDLKAENILIFDRFHLQISDFGLSKKIPRRAQHSPCGTPRDVAPEIMEKRPYYLGVDHWLLGVLLYFLTFQKYPFPDEPEENYSLKMGSDLDFPRERGCSSDLQNLIQQLLTPQVDLRLGYRNCCEEIFEHSWMRRFEDRAQRR